MNEENQAALNKLQEQLERKLEIKDGAEKLVLADGLADCMAEVLDYCNRDVLTGNMVKSVKGLFIIKYNREGSEGEVSREEGGIKRTYEQGIPREIRSQLNRYRLGSVKAL